MNVTPRPKQFYIYMMDSNVNDSIFLQSDVPRIVCL